MTKSNSTILLDDIFDPKKGWGFSVQEVPLQRASADDGNPYYLLTVDGIEIIAFEQSTWEAGVVRSVPASRLVVMTIFEGYKLSDANALLSGSYDARGLPSFGINEDGQITLQTAFPIAKGFPIDLARKQLMVCMGIISEESKELIRAWNENVDSEFDWRKAKNVASVAGTFLRAFLGVG